MKMEYNNNKTAHTLSDIRSLSWMRRAKKEFGSRDSVVLVVRKQVPPTFNFTHWLLPCFCNIFGLFRGFKFTVDIIFVFLLFCVEGGGIVTASNEVAPHSPNSSSDKFKIKITKPKTTTKKKNVETKHFNWN